MAHNRIAYTDGFFRNSRGQKLFYSAFFPKNSAKEGVQGVVIFMHGINEHSQRFTHVYETLVDLGFGVIAHDMIGHGKSDCDVDGLRGHSEHFHHMVDDTNAFLTVSKYSIYRRMLPATQQQPPLYFMGISYGCLVGMHTILSAVHPFAGVVMAAPALGVEQTIALRIQSLLSGPIVKAFPHAKIVPGVNFDALSRNTEFVRDYMNDKLNITDKMTARMGALSMEAMQLLTGNKHVEDADSAFCKLPILIIQGTADKVTSVAVARAFYQRISNFDKQMKEYDGFFHCLFNEPEKDMVLEDVTSWLLARARHHAKTARAIAETKQTPALPAARL